MLLRSITLTGYRSAAHGEPMRIEGLGKFNAFIGPNNSGKSTVCRFIQVVASLIDKKEDFPLRLPWESADASWWWQGDVTKPILATLAFTGHLPSHQLEKGLPGNLEHQGEWQFSVELRATEGTACLVLIAPHVFVNGAWHPTVRAKDHAGMDLENLNRIGQYVSSRGSDACPYHGPGLEILRAWSRCVRFYDPVRAIDRGAGRRGLSDGSGLLKALYQEQGDHKQNHAYERFRSRLIQELNELLFDQKAPNKIISLEIKGPSEDNLDLYIKRDGDAAAVALQYMGTGVAELAIVLADIVRGSGARQYFIEEPECHLHPGLLRRLLARLTQLPDTQFFVTTHSTAILDSINRDDAIFRFDFSPTRGTSPL